MTMKEIRITKRSSNAVARIEEALAQGKRVMGSVRGPRREWLPVKTFRAHQIQSGETIWWVSVQAEYGPVGPVDVNSVRWEEK